jgi:hypothetical protein
MNVILLRILGFFFAPFLKGGDEKEEEDYYQILKLNKKCSLHDIKKSYRKASLMMHPDKVAQFSKATHKTAEEIQHEFILIKEAYETLSDPTKRSLYDALGKEGMKAMNRGDGGLNIHILAYNLSHASCMDRSKLFLLPVLLVGFFLITPILICAKVDATLASKTGLADVSWLLTLIPIWIFNVCFMVAELLGNGFFGFGKMACATLTAIFLALRWDNHIQWKYSILLIPLCIHQFIGIIEGILMVHTAHQDMSRMTTVSWLEKNVLPKFNSAPGDMSSDEEVANTTRQTYDSLTDEEKEMINEIYIIVEDASDEVQYDDLPSTSSLQDEVRLLHAISKSPEFKLAQTTKAVAQKQMFSIAFFHIAFLVLLVIKLDYGKDWSWQIVFTPLWIELCIKSLNNCFQAFCLPFVFIRSENNHDLNSVQKDDESCGANKETGEVDAITTEDEIHQTSGMKVLSHDSTTPIKGSGTSFSHQYNDNEKNDVNVIDINDEGIHEDVERNNNNDDDDDDDNYVEFDPESFENQGKAMCSCCINILLIVALSLFLVKLDGSESEGSQGQFSAFWVIFPLLLVAGIVLLMFACCIYASSHADQVESMINKRDSDYHTSDKNNPDASGEPIESNEERNGAVSGVDQKIEDLD